MSRPKIIIIALLFASNTMANPDKETDFYTEIYPLLQASACIRAADVWTVAMIAALISRIQDRHYGPNSTAEELRRARSIIGTAETLHRAALLDASPAEARALCFEAGRKLELVLKRMVPER